MTSSELSAFLQAQRSRLRPEDVGVERDRVPRRVPGLRREEVARLAGVSTDYYTRLEQGRRAHPSEQVLDAVARALRLDETGRQHLIDLARPAPRTTRPRPVQRVRWATQQLIDSWTDQPAMVLGRGTDVLATNALGRALLFDFETLPGRERNYTRWILLDPLARDLLRDWTVVASEMVAVLRMEAGHHPDDRRISDLVGELTVRSPEFAAWWADHRVLAHHHGSKRFHHPVVGDLELDWQGLVLPGDEDQTIFVYHAPPGTPAADALTLLASWTAHGKPDPRDRSATEPSEPSPGRS